MKTRVASSTKLQFCQGLGKVKVIYFTELKNRHFPDCSEALHVMRYSLLMNDYKLSKEFAIPGD